MSDELRPTLARGTVRGRAETDAFRLLPDEPELEVLRAIVMPYAVDVVDFFAAREIAPEDAFHDQAMLPDVPGAIGVRVIGRPACYVSALGGVTPAFPASRVGSTVWTGPVVGLQVRQTAGSRAVRLEPLIIPSGEAHLGAASQTQAGHDGRWSRSGDVGRADRTPLRAVQARAILAIRRRHGCRAEWAEGILVRHREASLPGVTPSVVDATRGHSCVGIVP
jgi:hypothetical protein